MGTEIGLGLEITELRLGLPGRGSGGAWMEKNEKKRAFSEIDDNDNDHQRSRACNKSRATEQAAVVGWPPVCSYRKKINQISMMKAYVKVSMDGAPFLRKIDMSNYKEYSDFVEALEKLFGCFGALGEQGLKKEGDSSEYTAIYEDKDGDWMLVGDVPWEMFIETCKRLRIKKSSDGNGIGMLNACNKV